MIDIREIREDSARFAKAAIDKHVPADIKALLAVDQELAEAKKALQGIATEKNRLGKSIPKMTTD
jgi:seryl-tRNA synthetase